jgi:hypothetical protein
MTLAPGRVSKEDNDGKWSVLAISTTSNKEENTVIYKCNEVINLTNRTSLVLT